MPKILKLYNLREYIHNYSKTSRSNTKNPESFKFKAKLTG